MRRLVQCQRTISTALIYLVVGCACASQSRSHAEGSSAPHPPANGGVGGDARPTSEIKPMRMTIGTTTVSVTLYDSATVRAFQAMLPLTLNMADLNANEKHARLRKSLPVDASNPGTIQAGDLMLYGSNTLVLFYETFATSYDYTRIGKCDDPSALVAILGSGDVAVTFAP